jgi:hypothetical protein
MANHCSWALSGQIFDAWASNAAISTPASSKSGRSGSVCPQLPLSMHPDCPTWLILCTAFAALSAFVASAFVRACVHHRPCGRDTGQHTAWQGTAVRTTQLQPLSPARPVCGPQSSTPTGGHSDTGWAFVEFDQLARRARRTCATGGSPAPSRRHAAASTSSADDRTAPQARRALQSKKLTSPADTAAVNPAETPASARRQMRRHQRSPASPHAPCVEEERRGRCACIRIFEIRGCNLLRMYLTME